MGRGGGDVGVAGGLAVVDVDVVDDDVGDVLEGDAASAGDVDGVAAAVDGLEGVDDELGFEFDCHVGGEGDPEGFGLDDGVAESAGCWVGGVAVGGVGDDVDLAAFAAHCVCAEADAAVGELLAVVGPVGGGAAPAVVDGVARGALLVIEGQHFAAGEGGIDSPVQKQSETEHY